MNNNLSVLEPEFYGNRVLLLSDNINAFVGMRSVIEGIGLIWYRQKQKINEEKCSQRLNFRLKGRRYNTVFLHKNFVQEYLDQIDIIRIPKKKRDRVNLYRLEFIDFIDSKLINVNRSIYDSYLDSGILGIKKLIKDSIEMPYHKGFEDIARIIHHLMKDPNLTNEQLLDISEIYEIADYLSRNQFRLKKDQSIAS